MNLFSTMAIKAYGTAEGVKKEWDTRGRKGEEDDAGFKTECIGPDCGLEPSGERDKNTPPIVVPHLDNLELMMTSSKPGQNIHFDKQALKDVLHAALMQLERDDVETKYMNSANFGKTTTDHYVNIKFRQPGIKGARV